MNKTERIGISRFTCLTLGILNNASHLVKKKLLARYCQELFLLKFSYRMIVCVRSGPMDTSLIGTFSSCSK